MEDSINIKTEEFKQNLYNLINQSNLPISNVYYVMKDVFKELEGIYLNTLQQERIKRQKIKKEENKKEQE